MGASMGSVSGKNSPAPSNTAPKPAPPSSLSTPPAAPACTKASLPHANGKNRCRLRPPREARVPHISLLVDPCYGGVTASYATVADIIMAEPGALIGFAGPRVIEQITKQKLPEGFQTAEFFLDHGMIDLIVDRPSLRRRLVELLDHYALAGQVDRGESITWMPTAFIPPAGEPDGLVHDPATALTLDGQNGSAR